MNNLFLTWIRDDLETNYNALTIWQYKHIEMIEKMIVNNNIKLTDDVSEYLCYLINYNLGKED